MNLQFGQKTSFFLQQKTPDPTASLGRDGALPAPARAVWLRVRVNVREIHAFVFAVNEECGSACNNES
jgi:hypothetical protein